MSEKGILINDQVDGTSIATRSAYELDELSNARVIPRIMPVNKHIPHPLVAIRTDITGNDSLDLSSLPSNLTDNIISCGDKTKLCVIAEFAGAGTQSFDALPVFFDNEASPGIVGMGYKLAIYAGSTNNVYRTTGGLDVVSILYEYELNGAHKIGTLITNATITTTAILWAYLL